MRSKKNIALQFAAVIMVALSLTLTGCDFGNNTSDTTSAGAEEGTLQEGDNADDKQAENGNGKEDTTGVSSFQ